MAYYTAQVCKNGHAITPMFEIHPENSQKFCNRCGELTITRCPSCNTPIRGYPDSGIISIYYPPAFCYNCGKPFPWTESRLNASKELADTLKKLKPDEKEILKQSIDELVRDTPQAKTAAVKFKTFLAYAGKKVASVFRDLLVDIISESAKKIIWPTG